MDCRKLRYRLGWSQQDVADYLGISRAMVALIETRRNRPGVETAYRYIDLAAENGVRLRLEDVYPRD